MVGRIRFSTQSGTGGLGGERLPLAVQIRDSQSRVLASGLADRPFELPSGEYYATARMPDGTQPVIVGKFLVADGEDRELSVEHNAGMDAQPAAVSLDPVAGEFVTAWRAALKGKGPAPARDSPKPQVEAGCIWRGDWFGGWLEGETFDLEFDTKLRSDDGIWISPEKVGRCYIAVPEKGLETATFFAVPFDGPVGEPTRVTMSRDKHGKPQMEYEFKLPHVTEMLRFVRSTLFNEASEYAERSVLLAKKQIDQDSECWLEAIIASYVLLRLNKINEFEEYTGNLLHLSTCVPDVLALRVEYLARVGRDEAAARQLLELKNVGLPWGRSGVQYLQNRARHYSRMDLGFKRQEKAELTAYSSTLTEICNYLAPDQTVATYRDVRINNGREA